MSKEKVDQLLVVASPVVEFIKDNYHPNTIVVIQYDRVDLYTAEIGGGIKQENKNR